MSPLRMPTFDGIYDACIAADRAILIINPMLPQQMHDKLDVYYGDTFGDHSAVDTICNFVEATFANRPALVPDSNVTPGLMLVAAGCAQVIHTYGFWSDLEGRALGIQLALQRDAGQDVPDGADPWPDAADDPAPKDGYGPPAP